MSSVPRLNAQVCPKVTLDFCAVEQASEFQDCVGSNDGAAINNLDSPRTVDHAHNDTAGTVFDPGIISLMRSQVPNGTVDITVEMEAQTELIPNPASMSLEPRPRTRHSHERLKSSRRHRGGIFRSHFGPPLVPVRYSRCNALGLEMWWLVSGQPTCIETEGPVRFPVEDRSRCCVPCVWRSSP